MTKTFIKTALITVLAGIATVPAQAQDRNADGVAVVGIDPSGYDLSTAEGVNALTARVRISARHVCDTGSNDLGMIMKENACFKAAFANARDRIEQLRSQTAERDNGQLTFASTDGRPTR